MTMCIFSYVCWLFMYLLWRIIHSSPLPIFKLFFAVVVVEWHYFCTLDINPLSEIWFANSFFHPICYLFTLITVQMCLSLIQFHLAIPAFCACAFSIIFNKTLPNPVPQRFSPVFYCRSCIISHSMLVLIYFDLTFVFSIRENSNFFFACGYSIFPALFVEEIFFPLYPWHSLQRSNDHIHGSLFLSFLLYSIGVYISVFI